MFDWIRKRSLPVRVLVFATAAALAFVMAAGLGAIGALTLGGDVGLLEREKPRPADQQDAGRPQQEDAAPQQDEEAFRQGEAAPQQDEDASRKDEAEYVGTVGDIQTRAIETFLGSHDRLRRYDALTADDIEEMQANEVALERMADRAGELAPPGKYEGQLEVFGAAVGELHQAARLAYDMAADPVVATDASFDEYESRVKEASALLRRSNQLLGKDYETIEGVQEVSPEF